MDLILQSRFQPTARIGGRDTGAWATSAGGEISNDAQKDRPPGSDFGVPVPGLGDISNVTLTRTFDADRDTDEFKAFMRKQVRAGSQSVIGVPVLDANKNPKGRETYTGIIVRYKHPETDSNSSDKAVAEVEFMISGIA